MKKLYDINVKLKTESDIFGNFERIKMVSINKMYTGGKTQGRKGKRSTPELILYKNFLRREIEKFIEKNPKNKYDLQQELFYTIELKISPKRNKDFSINQTSISDADGYIKAIQDSFETKRDKDGNILELGFWKNDKVIKGFLPFIEYTNSDYDEFTITVFEYNEDFKEKIKKFFKI